ncbi:Monocarboxylate transporter 12-B [Collichthys lucidus]|uniref:Monocarboxylate transporter 12-B n=1 Tax=Collichthys lucidus TaxID=240159 RepID=A0A4U5VMU3_COLLU|nr:Monocarboxylate transporter 12-B [Collichthys lucidus]
MKGEGRKKRGGGEEEEQGRRRGGAGEEQGRRRGGAGEEEGRSRGGAGEEEGRSRGGGAEGSMHVEPYPPQNQNQNQDQNQHQELRESGCLSAAMVDGKPQSVMASHLDGGWGWAHFGADYSATAWIHSLVDCTTMLCGVGFALCYTPAIAMVGCYFRQRKALAYGIAMSGSGIGTFVLAPVVQLLIELYSWRGALLVLSAFVANLCVCGALLRPITVRKDEEEAAGEKGESAGKERLDHISDAELALKLSNQSEDSLLPPAKSSSLSCLPLPLLSGNPAPQLQRRWCFSSCFLSSKEYRFLLLPDFLGLALSFLFLACGCSLPFVYLVPYALSGGVSHQQAAFLMSILGVIDIVGNITFGWLTDRRCLKPYRLASYVFSVGMEGLCCLFVPLLRSFPLLIPFAVLYGYFDGAYVALIPVVTSDLVGTPYLSSALGVVYFLHAIPYLVSPPIGGWMVDLTGSYTATFFLSGAAMLSSSLVLSIVAVIRHCRRCKMTTVINDTKH